MSSASGHDTCQWPFGIYACGSSLCCSAQCERAASATYSCKACLSRLKAMVTNVSGRTLCVSKFGSLKPHRATSVVLRYSDP